MFVVVLFVRLFVLDVVDTKDSTAYCVLHVRSCPVPWVDFLAAGCVCSGKSKLNRKRRLNQFAVVEGRGATGITWNALLAYVEEHGPNMRFGENVVELIDGGEAL